MKRVISNKGSYRVDGMAVYELRQFLKDNWLQIKQKTDPLHQLDLI